MGTLEEIAEAISEQGTVTLDLLNRYFRENEKHEIHSLDDIEALHATVDLSSLLSIEQKPRGKLRDRLVQYKVFSPNLMDYTLEQQERIVEKMLTIKPRIRSAYFDVDQATVESNRRIVANSAKFIKYLKEHGIASLDDFTVRDAPAKVMSMLGIDGSTSKLQKQLIHYGVFPIRLSDYSAEQQERIVEKILELESKKSIYLKADQEVAEENRKIIANSATFREYLRERGITDLTDITKQGSFTRVQKILGVTSDRFSGTRKQLIHYGVFPIRLSDYPAEQQERIAKKALKFTKGHFNPYLGVEGAILEENKLVIVKTNAFREYFREHGISSLDEIIRKHTDGGIRTLLGTKNGDFLSVRKQLAKHGVFSGKLSDYNTEELERIAERIVEKVCTKFMSGYFSDLEVLKDNRETLLGTKAVHDFLARECVDLQDVEGTAKSTKARLFFMKYFGINMREIGITSRYGKAKSHHIYAEWDQKHEEMLHDFCKNLTPELLPSVLRNRMKELQETFGRSYSAILSKVQRLGLLSKYGFNVEDGTISNASYAFPKIHEQELGGTEWYFRNVSFLLERGRSLTFVPVMGFESAVHRQFTHITVPIHYNGIDLSAYSAEEQRIMCVLAAYMADRESFMPARGLAEIVQPDILDAEPTIIELRNGKKPYSQLIFRRELNPYDSEAKRTRTEVIGAGNTLIYHFKHEGEMTFEGTRT